MSHFVKNSSLDLRIDRHLCAVIHVKGCSGGNICIFSPSYDIKFLIHVFRIE